MLLMYQENLSSARWAKDLGSVIRRCNAVSSEHWPMARWWRSMIVRDRKEPTITPEAKAWLVSLACNKTEDHGFRRNYGRRGSWRAMRANRGRQQSMHVWLIWSRKRCARSSAKRKSSRTR